MSIPLDRLYHYIEYVAQEARGNNVLIYRFYPHGSKKLSDLSPTHVTHDGYHSRNTIPQIYCHDQEPLNFDFYSKFDPNTVLAPGLVKLLENIGFDFYSYNLRAFGWFNILDKCILVHSEQRSADLERYRADQYIPVYYWNHAILALDWYRYAKYIEQSPGANAHKFLIYNRAWSGTREYRLKFLDLLIDNNINMHCHTKCNPRDPETQVHYNDHQFNNINWKPSNILEDYFSPNEISSDASADFNLTDYNNSDIEVVLETLFDDGRLHLTEKSLRPIACGQPFILAATHGSLEYLRSYGFQTFGDVIDESYDVIVDPVQRLNAIVKTMTDIANWSEQERQEKINKLTLIAQANKQHFFSNSFFNQVDQELKNNMKFALLELETTNTSEKWLAQRRWFCQNPEMRKYQTTDNAYRSRQDIAKLVLKAKKYQSKTGNK